MSDHRAGLVLDTIYVLASGRESFLFREKRTRRGFRPVWKRHLSVWRRASAHHDDQQDVVEVLPESQRGAAEESEVSLQELEKKKPMLAKSRFYKNTRVCDSV